MKTRNSGLRLAAWASLVWVASAALGQDFSILLPELKTLPAPDWVKPGVRLTFYQASASIPSQRYYYWQDEKGDFKCVSGPDAGLNFKRAENAGASGHGIVQIDIVAVDQKEVQLGVVRWGFMNGQVVPFGVSADAGLPATGADFWLPPRFSRPCPSIGPRRSPSSACPIPSPTGSSSRPSAL